MYRVSWDCTRKALGLWPNACLIITLPSVKQLQNRLKWCLSHVFCFLFFKTDAFSLQTKDLFKLFYSRYNASMTCHFLWNTLLHFGLTHYFPNDYLSSALCLSNEQKVQDNKINKPQQNDEKATMHHSFSREQIESGANKKGIVT